MVQLDSAVLAGDPPDETVAANAPAMWHRDRFGSVPPSAYIRPASVVFICYLQDMTPEVGQLRVLPGSHRRPDRVPDSGLHAPVDGERLLGLGAGDVIALHHNVLHSGGRNTSGRERRFLGFIYNVSMLRQEDNFDGPNCVLVREAARRCHDRRLLRLLGADPLIFPRQNSGFTGDMATAWSAWTAEDEAHAAGRGDAQEQAARVRGRHSQFDASDRASANHQAAVVSEPG